MGFNAYFTLFLVKVRVNECLAGIEIEPHRIRVHRRVRNPPPPPKPKNKLNGEKESSQLKKAKKEEKINK